MSTPLPPPLVLWLTHPSAGAVVIVLVIIVHATRVHHVVKRK